MSDSQVIARKFRPQTFDQMVGQEAIRRTIENSIKSGRIHHAYLFTGARGVGKTTTARILAKALNCVKGPTIEPCGVCASCVEISASHSIDVMEIDAASNTGVDNVRDVIINTVQISPARDRYKIFIIDEVHMLSTQAFNALLKTIEEPPPRVAFIMATTELHKVPETILSRCQVFEFRTITLKKIFHQLKNIAADLGVQISDAALLSVARAGEGSMRDAQSALDQVISFAGNQVSDEDVSAALGLVDIETLNTTMRAIGEQDAARLLRLVDEIVGRGYDLRNFCRETMTHIRAILVTKVSGFDAELVQMPAGEGESLVRLAEMFSEQDLIRFFSILTKTEQDIRASSQPRFQLEIGLMKLLQSRRLYLLEDAIKQMSEIASQLGGTGSSGSRAPSKGSASFSSQQPSQGADFSSKSSSFSSINATAQSRPFQKAMDEAQAKTNAPGAAVPNRPSNFEKASTALGESLHSESLPNNLPFSSQPAKVETKIETRNLQVSPAPSATLRSSPSPVNISTATRVAASAPPPWADEPPPAWDDPYDGEPALPPVTFASGRGEQNLVGRLKESLQTNKKMMLLSFLNQAESIKLDGDYLRITYTGETARNKSLVESSTNRRAIEEVCKEVTGRKITLSVLVGGATNGGETNFKDAKEAKQPDEDHPTLRAIAEKFKGEIIEIVKSED